MRCWGEEGNSKDVGCNTGERRATTKTRGAVSGEEGDSEDMGFGGEGIGNGWEKKCGKVREDDVVEAEE